jgi:large subunit ribosomal protein L30
MDNLKFFKVTLVKSLIGRKVSHRKCAHGLGLRKIRQSSLCLDTVENRGMVNRISYMLRIEDRG